MDSQTLHRCHRKLQTNKGSVLDPRADPRVHQPPPQRGALPSLEHIQALPKPQDLTNLQARVDCLLKENGELKTKVEEGEALRKETMELKDRIAVLEEEVKTAQEKQDKSKEVARKIHSFMGFPSDVVNKARMYDQSLRQPKTTSGAKMMRCIVVIQKTQVNPSSALKRPKHHQSDQSIIPRIQGCLLCRDGPCSVTTSRQNRHDDGTTSCRTLSLP